MSPKQILSAFCLVIMIPVLTHGQIKTSEKVRFLALGDSYTIGQSVSAKERWPEQLIDSLRSKGFSCHDPRIIATTGWRTDNLKLAIQNASLSNNYNLVSLLIGVNNFYQGRSSSAYSVEFDELLTMAINLAGGNKDHVFVVSIPDYGYTPFGAGNQSQISAGINEFNSINKSITDSKGVTYIEITDISRLGLQQPDLVATDGLHPSGKMYTQWVSRILDKLSVEETITNTELNPESSIKIFPNPTQTHMIIENLPSSGTHFRITLNNGRGITALQTGFISENRKAQIDIKTLPAGTYFYQLSDKSGVLKSGKVVKR